MKYLNWVQMVLGIWIMVSPWILGFSDITTALWSNVVVGALVAIFSLWQIFGHKCGSPSSPSAPQMPPQMPPTQSQ